MKVTYNLILEFDEGVGPSMLDVQQALESAAWWTGRYLARHGPFNVDQQEDWKDPRVTIKLNRSE